METVYRDICHVNKRAYLQQAIIQYSIMCIDNFVDGSGFWTSWAFVILYGCMTFKFSSPLFNVENEGREFFKVESNSFRMTIRVKPFETKYFINSPNLNFIHFLESVKTYLIHWIARNKQLRRTWKIS